MKKTAVLAFICFHISACSMFDEQPVSLSDMPLIYKEARVRIIDPRYKFENPRQHGLILMHENKGVRTCDIYLRDYPRYLGHETDHCFRGLWHGLETNDHDFK